MLIAVNVPKVGQILQTCRPWDGLGVLLAPFGGLDLGYAGWERAVRHGIEPAGATPLRGGAFTLDKYKVKNARVVTVFETCASVGLRGSKRG